MYDSTQFMLTIRIFVITYWETILQQSYLHADHVLRANGKTDVRASG